MERSLWLHDCECALLTAFDVDQVSPWSDFSDGSDISSPDTKSRCPNPIKRAQTHSTNRRGYGSAGRTHRFEHHENYHSYMDDYRRAHQRRTRRYGHGSQAVATPYNVTCNLQLPVNAERQKSGILVRQQTADRESGCHVESVQKFLNSCYYVQPRLPTASGRRSVLTYSDIKDYVVNEPKDEPTTKFLKPRKLEINLTGKFVKRIASSRCTRSTKVEMSSRRQPLGQCKLPVPQKPLLTCNYNLPASLPSRVTEKFGHQSARTRTQRQLPRPTPSSQTTPTRSPNNSQNDENSLDNNRLSVPTPRLTYTTFYNDINIKPVGRQVVVNTTSKLDTDRKKNLQQLVEILGETHLTPYLRKLTVGQNVAQPILNADNIDYSVIFGSRL